jgi:tRNA 2-thiouridine synthesizing protein D
MRFTIVVQCPPQSCTDSLNALNFAAAALNAGHTIDKIFFYGDGVYTANALSTNVQNETSVSLQWQHFIEENAVDALVCISSATQRGIINESESKRLNINNVSCLPCFRIAGLGELIEAHQDSNRLIQFH